MSSPRTLCCLTVCMPQPKFLLQILSCCGLGYVGAWPGRGIWAGCEAGYRGERVKLKLLPNR